MRGVAQVRLRGWVNEIDAVSELYIAQHKPANFVVNKSFRNQAKTSFEIAKATGRQVYYKFANEPAQDVINKLNEYSQRYGVPVIIKF